MPTDVQNWSGSILLRAANTELLSAHARGERFINDGQELQWELRVTTEEAVDLSDAEEIFVANGGREGTGRVRLGSYKQTWGGDDLQNQQLTIDGVGPPSFGRQEVAVSGNQPAATGTIGAEVFASSPSADVVARTDSASIRLASLDVVESLARQIADSTDDAQERALAESVVPLLAFLRDFANGDSTPGSAEKVVEALRSLAGYLVNLAGYAQLGELGRGIFSLLEGG